VPIAFGIKTRFMFVLEIPEMARKISEIPWKIN
jgi:hypothetical protein